MKVSRFDKPMFRAAFDASEDEQRRLIDFLSWLRAENVSARLLDHPLGPSPLWKTWANETFVGFSTGKILLQSGHRFAHAELVPAARRRWWQRATDDTEKQRRQFMASYPDFTVRPEHAALMALHPGAFLRSAEATALSNVSASRMLEIGAGNAVHVAYRHLQRPDMKTTVIDLPESMIVGFILLRTMGIDAALPNETHDAPVTMRLPFQTIDGPFDFAFNMSSFQEMSPETVNGYLALVQHKCAGGVLQHVNYEKSRYIEGNDVRLYAYRGTPAYRPAPFHSALAPQLPRVVSVLVSLPAA